MGSMSGTNPVYLVHLVYLVQLVGLVEPNKQDKPSKGGFKFQVQRVNDDADAYRLPGAWRSSDIFWGAC